MKKKLDVWILNIFLTVVAAFQLSGGVFTEPRVIVSGVKEVWGPSSFQVKIHNFC